MGVAGHGEQQCGAGRHGNMVACSSSWAEEHGDGWPREGDMVPWGTWGCVLCPQFPALVLKLVLLFLGGRLVAAGTVTRGELVTILMCQLHFTEAVEVISVSCTCHQYVLSCP